MDFESELNFPAVRRQRRESESKVYANKIEIDFCFVFVGM